LKLSNKRAALRVRDPSDPKRQLCNPMDTESYVCGSNTSVQSDVFKRAP
jgi:hypothetical protein